MDILTPFSTRSHPSTDPLFQFALSLSPNEPPFLIIHNQFLTISHRMTPIFCQHFHFFRNFCQNCVQICILCGKFAKICLILTIWLLFLAASLNDPLFSEKNLTKRPLVLSYCPSRRAPPHFQSWVPPTDIQRRSQNLRPFYSMGLKLGVFGFFP